MNVQGWIDKINDTLRYCEGTVLLGVSGGVDSMVLLHLLHQMNKSIVVAHVNYGLRGENSDLDEQLVRETCASLSVLFESKRVDTLGFCAAHKVGIQEGARLIRYTWFEELKRKHALQYVLTAHHLSDNVETFFMNALRGSGLQGLKSMKTFHQQTGIVRPLLFATKQEVVDFAKSHNIVFREDSSNAKNDYHRNAIRNQWIPIVQQLDPQAAHKIGKTITHLQEDFDYLEKTLEREAKEVLKQKGDTFAISNYKMVHPRLLRYCLTKFEFQPNIVEEVSRMQQAGRIIQGNSYTLLLDREDIFIRPNQVVISAVNEEVKSEGKFELTDGTVVNISVVDGNTIETTTSAVYFDAEVIRFPFTIRNWKPGDVIIPFGMNGSKKVSDVLTDKKYSIWEKEKSLVLEYDTKIVWIVGIQTSEYGKITSSTKKMIKIETAH
jgi:tRNA(Ile)-lysidine synthase